MPYYHLLEYRIGQALGWETARMGHGGSGYVYNNADATSEPMTNATRLGELAEWAPEFAIILGSVNDDSIDDGGAQVGAAAESVYVTPADTTPATKLIVVGPHKLATDTPASRLANRDAIRTAALAAPNVIGFVDPIAENMIDTTESALLGDGTHFTAEGHRIWTERLIDLLMAG